jgi:hypothetical protein
MTLAERLRPKSAELRGLIFENANIGLARGLFWSVELEFKPFVQRGERFEPMLSAEWIRHDVRDWRELVTAEWSYTARQKSPAFESSFYTFEHDPVIATTIRLNSRGGRRFELSWEAIVDYPGFSEGEAEPRLRIVTSANAAFKGVLIHPETVKPIARNEARARATAEEFLDLSSFRGGLQLVKNDFGMTGWVLSP